MKQVNPRVYTKKYYLSDCTGFDEFKKNYGRVLEPRLKEISKHINFKRNMTVLDIGCGRGELALWLAENKVDVYAIDYSKDAISLAKKAYLARKKRIKSKVFFSVLDAHNINNINKKFDLIIMTEIFEHLYKEEQIDILKKAKKLLKNNGYILIHTSPSKTFIDITYKIWCYPISSIVVKINNLITKKKYPNIAHPKYLRTDSHKIMHVNEPTYFDMLNIFKKLNFNFSIQTTNITIKKPEIGWKDKFFNFLVYLYPFSKHFPFNVLWGNDFLAILKNK